MADTKLETTETDPAATSLANDESVNKPAEEQVPAGDGKDAPADDGAAKDTAVETEGNTVATTEETTEKSKAPAATESTPALPASQESVNRMIALLEGMKSQPSSGF